MGVGMTETSCGLPSVDGERHRGDPGRQAAPPSWALCNVIRAAGDPLESRPPPGGERRVQGHVSRPVPPAPVGVVEQVVLVLVGELDAEVSIHVVTVRL
jgi:hypothetical protein